MSFSKVIGQNQAIGLLKKNVEEHRVAKAYLFHGPEGVGKKLTAYVMAQALLCESESKPCGQCGSCHKFDHQVHADFHTIETEDASVKIDMIRSVIQKISLKPVEGEKSVIFIDNVENMTESAANALLKTLEEPPEHVTLILISCAFERLLPTILSRCQKIAFHSLSLEDMRQVLLQKYEGAKEDIEGLLRLADGSPGKALKLPPEIKEELRKDLFQFLVKLPRVPFAEIQQWAETLARQEENRQSLFQLMHTWIRDAWVKQANPETQDLVHQDLLALNGFPQRSAKSLWRDSQLVLETNRAIDQNANKQLAFERLFLQFGR